MSADLEETSKKIYSPATIVEFFKSVFAAILIAFLISTFLFRPFHIPSSSMEPTLMPGDYLITSKYSLGYGKFAMPLISLPIDNGRIFERSPTRGDILVFKSINSKVYFIKRLVGLPGDSIQMKNGALFINDVQQKTDRLAVSTQSDIAGNPVKFKLYREYFTQNAIPHLIKDKQLGSVVDNTGIYKVPNGHYFFIGDNRDNSIDSRYTIENGGIGNVPSSHLVGRAEFILLSVKDGFRIFKPWTWGNMRGDRFLKRLD